MSQIKHLAKYCESLRCILFLWILYTVTWRSRSTILYIFRSTEPSTHLSWVHYETDSIYGDRRLCYVSRDDALPNTVRSHIKHLRDSLHTSPWQHIKVEGLPHHLFYHSAHTLKAPISQLSHIQVYVFAHHLYLNKPHVPHTPKDSKKLHIHHTSKR